MSSLIFMSVKGETQGLISAGCNTFDSIGNLYQHGHEDECFVLSLQHLMTREQHASHHPIIILKPIDKSSPLIASSLSNNEKLEVMIYMYRTSRNGGIEKYYSIRLDDARIKSIKCDYPHSQTSNNMMPQEAISLSYRDITWNHIACATGSYSFWDDRVY
jgi:type VI secretion system Hcp family effector